MVRELTKSALSFSWALSLLGLKQAVNLGRSGQQNGGDLLAPVTQIAVGQLDESMKNIYRSGDSLQSRMVDMAFSWMNPANAVNPSNWGNMGNWANPATWINPSNWMRMFTDLTQASAGCCGQNAASGQTSSASQPSSNQSAASGWGPMP